MLKKRLHRREVTDQSAKDNLGSSDTDASGSSTVRSVTANPISQKYEMAASQLTSRWQALPPRDRLALSVLIVFLLLVFGGYGGYQLHTSANQSKQAYQQAVADYFWLRSQSANIVAAAHIGGSGSDDQNPAAAISTLLSQASVENAKVAAAGESVQLSFHHSSQAIIAQVLGKIKQRGWRFERLSLVQDRTTRQLQVQATVSR